MDRYDPSCCHLEYTDGLVHAVLGHTDARSSQEVAHGLSPVIQRTNDKPQRIKEKSTLH